MNDLRKQPSKKVLIDNLRKKNIDEVFDNLLKELYIPAKDLRDMQQNTRSKIQSALSSVYDTHESKMLLPVQLVRASRRLRIDGLAGGNNALNPIAAVHARSRVTDNILGTRRRSRRGNTRS